jgi:hypothetical protein
VVKKIRILPLALRVRIGTVIKKLSQGRCLREGLVNRWNRDVKFLEEERVRENKSLR